MIVTLIIRMAKQGGEELTAEDTERLKSSFLKLVAGAPQHEPEAAETGTLPRHQQWSVIGQRLVGIGTLVRSL